MLLSSKKRHVQQLTRESLRSAAVGAKYVTRQRIDDVRKMNGRGAVDTQRRIDDVRKMNGRVALLKPSDGLMMWPEDESEK